MIILDQTRLLGRQYDADINQQRRTTPRLLDSTAFSAVKLKLTHYALELSSREWSATKKMADDIEEGKEEEFEFDLCVGCTFSCELPARFGLPCRHWMYSSIIEDCPLPLSLFHPRWLFDGPAVLYDCWVMTWDPELAPLAKGPSLAERYASDRYAARGLQRVEASALAVIDKLRSLPTGMAESFADSFAKGADSLLAQQDKKLASRKELPPMLPEPLVEETPLLYRKGKRRAMTGLEVAEERERDASRQRRRDERAAAALAVADAALEAREEERREEEDLIEAAWVADTQLQLSQLSNLDADDDRQEDTDGGQQEQNSSSLDASDNEDDAGPSCQLGSQAQPLENSSNDESNNSEPRRSGRVRRATRIVESQLSQIEKGLITAPGAKARSRALSAKKKQNTKVSQLEHEFMLIE